MTDVMDDERRGAMAAIVTSVRGGHYRYTVHGARQRIARGLRRHEIEEVIADGEIIEHYPEHHLGPACLVLGRSGAGRVIHIVCSIREMVDIITVYEPDPEEWDAEFRTRRVQP